MSCSCRQRGHRCRSLAHQAAAWLSLSFLVSPAWAQQGGLQTVEVTAQKRVQNLQEVPLSIEAFTATDLERAGVKDLSNLLEASPSVTSGAKNRTNGSNMGIRGINDVARNIGVDASVGVYLDGVYGGRTESNAQSLVGIERVEVLRGPQGTLYGKNTIAGALNITTRKPTDRFEVTAVADVGGFGTRSLGLWMGGAVSPGALQASLTLGTDRSDGWVKDLAQTGKNPGRGRSDSARAFARIQVSQALNVDLSVSTYQYRGVPAFGEIVATPASTAAQLAPLVTGVFNGNRDVSGPYTTATNLDSGESVNRSAGTATVHLNLNSGLRLTSITAHQKARNRFLYDEDQTVLDIIRSRPLLIHTRQTTQELRLASAIDQPMDWLAGLYGFWQDNDQTAAITLGPDYPTAGLRGLSAAYQGQLKTRALALFGQGNFRLTPSLHFTAGVRLTREKKDVTLEENGAPLVANIPTFSNGLTDHDVSPKLGLNGFVRKDLMVYVSATQGFKSGGYNVDAISPSVPVSNPAQILKFLKQKVTSIEVGLKSEWMDRSIRFNGSAFWLNGRDWQVQQWLPGPLPNSFFPVVTNAGKVKISGAEIDGVALLAANVMVKGGLAYTDARFVEFRNGYANGADYNGPLVNAPRLKSTLTAEVALPLGATTLRPSLTYQYVGEQFSNTQLLNPAFRMPAYDLFNARLGLEGRHWNVALWGRNLTNKSHITFAGTNPNLGWPRATYGQPRTVGVTASLEL